MLNLRILHIGNQCNIGTSIAKEMKKRGYDVHVIAYFAHCKLTPGDESYYIFEKFPFNLIKIILMLFRTFPKYDIYHFHDYSLLPKNIDLLIWRLIGKKVVLHYHGSSIRGKKTPYLSKYALKKVVSTPDLLEWVPDALLLLNPIDLVNYSKECDCYIGNREEKIAIRIVHAPTNRDVKGTVEVIESIHELQQNGYFIDFKIIENQPPAVVLEEFTKADIIVDQLKLDWYGMVSIEGMAIGVPVCTHIGEKFQKYIPENTLAYCDVR